MANYSLIIVSTFILCFSALKSNSQDIIKKSNGEELRTKVVEITDTLVKYKKFDDPEFSTYTISKKDVKSIIYENGKTINPNKLYKESYLALWVGPSLPVGIYSNGDPHKSNAGFAKPGLGSSFEFGFRITGKTGLSFNIGSFYHIYDHSSLDQQIHGNLNQNETVTTNYTNYIGGFLLAGYQYYVPLGKRFTWVNKISLGAMSFSKPEFSYNYTDSSSLATSVQTAAIGYHYTSDRGKGHSLAAGAGTALWFKVYNRFLIRASVDFMFARPKVHYSTHTEGAGIYGGSMGPDGDFSRKYKVNSINAGLSMIFLLRRNR